jgi:hypothetical protein
MAAGAQHALEETGIVHHGKRFGGARGGEKAQKLGTDALARKAA